MRELISGKQDLKRIVSIEIVDDTTEIFIQNDVGDVEVTYVPNEFWILSSELIGKGWIQLKGDLHYKYAKKFKTAPEFYRAKRYLRGQEADIYCINDPKESFLVKNGYTYYHGLMQKDVSVLSFDIETPGLDMDETSEVLIISNTFRKNGKIIRKMFTYDEYPDQGAMLRDWCEWVQEIDPSIIVGHNIYTFDLPYMQHVADMHMVELNLGRNGSPINFFNYESLKRIDGSRKQAYNKCRIYGREVIDTMFLAINYDIGKKYESYALKKIIAQENLEVKGRQFYDAANIRNTYMIPEEWVKIKLYALHDADDALALFDLMSPSFFYLSQSVPKSFQGIVESASGAQINAMMVRAYLQEGHSLPRVSQAEEFEGAISFGNPGIYRNGFKVDVASLYPSIMIQFEVYDKAKDPKGYMLKIIKIFTAERLANKKLAKDTGDKYYDDMQNAQKILINSFYGFMGAEGLIFNSPENAAFVTRKGREILQTAIDWAESKGLRIINADTDSITFCEQNGEEIDKEYQTYLLKDLNSLYPSRIKFEDDGYFHKIIVLKAKNYILYDGKKIKTKGSALKDAKKEKALKEFLNRVIEAIIQDKNNYAEIYNEYVKEAMNIKDIGRWASKKTISSKVLKNDRTNEAKIRAAIEGEEIFEGDRVYMFFKSDGSLALAERFDGDYDKDKMLEKIYKTARTFENVIPKDKFLNYKLKRNKENLEVLLEAQ